MSAECHVSNKLTLVGDEWFCDQNQHLSIYLTANAIADLTLSICLKKQKGAITSSSFITIAGN
ncbi:hypothetical protein VCHA50P415_10305 [Vibrio chagasii]|nr:hypothetical protein VCHA27O13_10283 [Vibrio chagasii]CAH6834115.1 hypothetical protein VCHA34P131_10206 [Vibrio chagasii]CAH6835858.1 hypothetical protein VCHA36O163_10202 [Vibrio chagasii]CAH6837539.1 hypothetical protein VCHA32P90_10296 [Vibrio chagasii]CAH6838285.1 hypothetical protein VCHA28O22_10286 [Vibrio chagasii]